MDFKIMLTLLGLRLIIFSKEPKKKTEKKRKKKAILTGAKFDYAKFLQ